MAMLKCRTFFTVNYTKRQMYLLNLVTAVTLSTAQFTLSMSAMDNQVFL